MNNKITKTIFICLGFLGEIICIFLALYGYRVIYMTTNDSYVLLPYVIVPLIVGILIVIFLFISYRVLIKYRLKKFNKNLN